jgi:hypothetical protein
MSVRKLKFIWCNVVDNYNLYKYVRIILADDFLAISHFLWRMLYYGIQDTD